MSDHEQGLTSGYHLFLEPEGTTAEKLSAIISALAEKYGGPVFPPHVTLLAEIPSTRSEEEIMQKAASLADATEPFTLMLGAFDAEDTFFRAFYAHVQEEPTLAACRAKAAELFIMPSLPYMPHLSLLYGNYDERAKADMRSSLEPLADIGFIADKIHLYKTEGTVSHWKKIATYPLIGA